MNPTEQEQYLINLRREKVQAGLACGKSLTSLSQDLNVSLPTISNDAAFLRLHARDYIKRYDEYFSEQYKQCLDFLDLVMSESWRTATNIKYERNKVSALALCKDCLLAKAMLISDIGLIDRTVSYVEGLKKKRKRLLNDDDEDTNIGKVLPKLVEEEDEMTVTEQDTDGGHAF